MLKWRSGKRVGLDSQCLHKHKFPILEIEPVILETFQNPALHGVIIKGLHEQEKAVTSSQSASTDDNCVNLSKIAEEAKENFLRKIDLFLNKFLYES